MYRTADRDTENYSMVTLIWIEPVKRADGSNWYTDRGIAAVLAIAVVPAAVSVAPAAADPWPGGSSVSVAAPDVDFKENLSGLAYQGSGGATKGVLYAVDNDPAKLWKLVWDGTKWT